jgi:hypothetical protein
MEKGHVSRHPVEGKTLILITLPDGLDLPGLEPLGIGTSPCSALSVDSLARQHRPAPQIASGRGELSERKRPPTEAAPISKLSNGDIFAAVGARSFL